MRLFEIIFKPFIKTSIKYVNIMTSKFMLEIENIQNIKDKLS